MNPANESDFSIHISERMKYLNDKSQIRCTYATDEILLYLDTEIKAFVVEYNSVLGSAFIQHRKLESEYEYEIGQDKTIICRFKFKNNLLKIGKSLKAGLNKRLLKEIKASKLIPKGDNGEDKNIDYLLETIYTAVNGDNNLDYANFLSEWDKLESKNLSFDLTEIDYSDIFWNDGTYYHEENVTPIFTVDNSVYYVIPLKSITIEGSKGNHIERVQGFYGLKSGFGFEPIPFYTMDEGAHLEIVSKDVTNLVNKNQESTIEHGIKEALKLSENVEKTPEIVATETPLVDIEPIQYDIKSRILYYIKLDHDIQYDILSCFIIGTYLFPLFPTFGYLILSGEKGAGKGTILDLIGLTCWNPTKKLVSISEAPLFRRIREQLPTIIIDEYHRAVKNPSSGNAIISILESGYETNGAVPRTEEYRDDNGIKKYRIVDYPVYCPKVLATRHPVEADEKGIKIIIPKIIDDEIYAKRKKELLNDTFFDDLRYKLMLWIIKNQSDILGEYKSIQPNKQLNGREFNVWLPILAIAKIAFPEEYEELLKFAGENVSKLRSTTYEKENRVLIALYDLYEENKLMDGGSKLSSKNPSYMVNNKEIRETLEFIEGDGMHHNAIKSALDNLKLCGYYASGKYYIKQEKLIEKFKERGFIKETPSLSRDSVIRLRNKYNLDEVNWDYLNGIQKAIFKSLNNYKERVVSNLIEDLTISTRYKKGELCETLKKMLKEELIII